ncbi:DUF3800 domain-containing protein [Pseudomonas oryzihabitans]|uniref:DUF3800 domain-containing protein n=1 Tax=Pseudomonas oryzihabitans TaxID=47885 RepID=UPI002B1D24DC|nr:DUF3800 domain-containing protein [Pseudomonas oryzihabitans]
MSKNSQTKRNKKVAKEKDKLRKTQAKINFNKAQIPTIYLDESGNTGHNLTDLNQPIFTLAGAKFSKQQSERLLSLLECKSPSEAHFKNLRRRKSGQDGIIRLIKHSLVSPDMVKVELIHKNYMITTKIVDILIETFMHSRGQDLYVNGQNIALSNMLHYCMPTFCGHESVNEMQASFVSMVKLQTEESIDLFYAKTEDLKAKSIDDNFKFEIDKILVTKTDIAEILDSIDKSSLDPSIPSFFSQCVHWGEDHPKGFYVIHDDSKSIEQQADLFSLFMDLTQSTIELGYDRRKFKLPLKALSLEFSNSQNHPQLQVADIIASAVAYWAKGIEKGEKEDYLFLELERLNIKRLLSPSSIWPTMQVSPEKLRTIFDGGLNPANHTSYFLMNAKPSTIRPNS